MLPGSTTAKQDRSGLTCRIEVWAYPCWAGQWAIGRGTGRHTQPNLNKSIPRFDRSVNPLRPQGWPSLFFGIRLEPGFADGHTTPGMIVRRTIGRFRLLSGDGLGNRCERGWR